MVGKNLIEIIVSFIVIVEKKQFAVRGLVTRHCAILADVEGAYWQR